MSVFIGWAMTATHFSCDDTWSPGWVSVWSTSGA